MDKRFLLFSTVFSVFLFFRHPCFLFSESSKNGTTSFSRISHILNQFNFIELKTAVSFTIPKESADTEKSAAGNTGIKLSLKNADIRNYVTLPKTSFSEIKSCETWNERAELLNDIRYGAGLFLFQKSFPFSVKAGTLTYSKSYSRLKNPAPSSSSNPLRKTFAFTSGLGPVLPTLTSSIQPLSAVASLGVSAEKISFPFSIDLCINEEKFLAASLKASFPLTKFTGFETCFTGGRFYIENNSTILKKNNAEFEAGWFYAVLGELSFKSPLLKMNFYAGIHQNPYDTACIWLKGDARLVIKNFLTDASYFFIPTTGKSPKAVPLIGGDSAICRVIEQSEINPQLSFLVNDGMAGSIRFGFLACNTWKITATNKAEEIDVLKLAFATSYETKIFSFRTDLTVANILLKGSPPTKSSTPEKYFEAEESIGFNAKNFNIFLKGGYRHYPPVTETSVLKEKVSIDLKCALGKKKGFLPQASFDLVLKDREIYSRQAGCSLTIKTKSKHINSSFKAGLTYIF